MIVVKKEVYESFTPKYSFIELLKISSTLWNIVFYPHWL